MNDLALHHFLPYLNQSFATTCNNKEQLLLLTEAKPLGKPSTSREPFSLLFLGEMPEPLPQGAYQLRHAGMGEIVIFLVPIARQVNGFVYQAVFN